MKHLKKFENFTGIESESESELLEEGLFDGTKKLISQIDGLDTKNPESVKNVFLTVFGKSNTKSDLGIKYWTKIKTNIDEFSTEDMVKVLQELKSDYTNNSVMGYVVNIGTELSYKSAGKVKTSSGFAGGGTGGNFKHGGV